MWLLFCYTIQLITIKFCVQFQNQVVAEKSLTEKKFTDRQTNIVTEKAKNYIPPIYFVPGVLRAFNAMSMSINKNYIQFCICLI